MVDKKCDECVKLASYEVISKLTGNSNFLCRKHYDNLTPIDDEGINKVIPILSEKTKQALDNFDYTKLFPSDSDYIASGYKKKGFEYKATDLCGSIGEPCKMCRKVHRLEQIVARLIDTLGRAECHNNYLDDYEGCHFSIDLDYDDFNDPSMRLDNILYDDKEAE